MPSASSKTSQPKIQTISTDLLQEPLKNVLQVFEKRQRNLEKRKLKLAEIKKKAASGEDLNEDQILALSKLALVDNSLDTVKELHKLIQTLEQEYCKLAKKEQKRSKLESRDQAEAQSRLLTSKIIQIEALLGDLSEDVRPDFLAGTNGACQLTEEEFSYLDSIYELINPSNNDEASERLSVRVSTASEHLLNLANGKDKEVVGSTYKQILSILDNVNNCGYFDKEEATVSDETVAVEKEIAVTEQLEEEVAAEVVAEQEEFPATTETQQEEPPQAVMEEESTPAHVNGVDLPPEVQQTPEDEKIDFLGESEIAIGGDQPSLNPVSPEFIPRTVQSEEASGWGEQEGKSGWEESNNKSATTQEGSETSNQGNNQQSGGFKTRGRGGNGGGNRGRGRGRGGFRGGRQDGGNYRTEGGGYRGEGSYRGDGGYYRGGNRGNRGSGNRGEGGGYRGGNRGARGGPRGGGNRDGQREGGFGARNPRPSNQ